MKPNTPESYAENLLLLLRSGNKRCEAAAETVLRDLVRYFFQTDPQFKEKV